MHRIVVIFFLGLGLISCGEAGTQKGEALTPGSGSSGSGSSGSGSSGSESGTESGLGSSGSESAPGTSGSESAPGTSGSESAPGTSGSESTPGTSGSGSAPGTSGSESAPGTSGSESAPGTSGSESTPGTSGSGSAPGTSGSESAPGTSGSGSSGSESPTSTPPLDAVKVRRVVFPALTDVHYTNTQELFSVYADITDDRIEAIIPDIGYTTDHELTITIAPGAQAVFQGVEHSGPTVNLLIQTFLADPALQITIKNNDEEHSYDIVVSRYDSTMATTRDLPEDTIPVYGQDNFAYITANPTLKYILVNDLALHGEHTPIAPDTNSATDGYQGRAFSGVFEGNDKTISNLKIAKENEDFIGFFGSITTVGFSAPDLSEGIVRNLILELADGNVNSPSIIGRNAVGGLVGSNGGHVERIAVKGGHVKGINAVGGLSGGSQGVTGVAASYATGDVSGTNEVGGLVGGLGGLIVTSYATGTVRGNDEVGGLVGLSSGEVRNSYATGDVHGNNDVGALVGWNNGPVATSYATGEVPKTGNNIGGLVGYVHSPNISIASSYFDASTTGTQKGVGSNPNEPGFTAYYTVDGVVRTGNGQSYPLISQTIFPTVDDPDTPENEIWDFVGTNADGTEGIWRMNLGEWPRLTWQ